MCLIPSSCSLQKNLQLLVRRDRYVQVFEESVGNIIYPPMYGRSLPATPRVPNDRRITDADDLSDHIKFAQPSCFLGVVRDSRQHHAILLVDVAHMEKGFLVPN
jgi:hypothetical protein